MRTELSCAWRIKDDVGVLKPAGHTFVEVADAGVEAGAEAGAGAGAGVGGPGIWATATTVLGQKIFFNVLNMAALHAIPFRFIPRLLIQLSLICELRPALINS